jgi:hypothetical protein
MASANVNGFTVGYTVAGAIVLWSGVKGATISNTARTVLSGKNSPAETEQITGSSSSGSSGGSAPAGDTTAHTATASQNQAIAKVLCARYGWSTGQNWADLVSLWNRESGWSNTIKNQSSGALGIAQALGHGTSTSAGSLGNEYPSKAANDGDASAQIEWGLSYIKTTYGSPSAAWAHEESAGWY